jgi:PAS domain-containing protein
MNKLTEIERIALVAENTDNLVVITDTERRIVWVNQAYTIMTGYSLEDKRR